MRVGKSVGKEEIKRHERIVFLGLFTKLSITWTLMAINYDFERKRYLEYPECRYCRARTSTRCVHIRYYKDYYRSPAW